MTRRIATLVAVLALAAIYLAYRRDMDSINKRLSADSKVHRTRHGSVEFQQGFQKS